MLAFHSIYYGNGVLNLFVGKLIPPRITEKDCAMEGCAPAFSPVLLEDR